MLKYDLIDNSKSEYIVLLHGYGGNSKCFKKQIDTLNKFFNILLIDMHGHGKSSNIHLNVTHTTTLKNIVDDIDTLLEELKIKKAHFMGLSLGTIVTNVYAYHYPKKVLSIINAGAVIKFKPLIKSSLNLIYNLRDKLPHNMFYTLAGHIIMPCKSHKISRDLFVREAKKMNNSDFYAWGRILIDFQDNYSMDKLNTSIDTLYISGREDYFFIDEVKKYCESYNRYLYILDDAGHICNIDNYNKFNSVVENYYLYIKNKKDTNKKM